MASESLVQPAVIDNFVRLAGSTENASETASLQLRFGQKEVQLVDERTAAPLLSRPLGRRGSLPFALAGLQGGGTIHCSLRAVHLEGQQEEGAASVLLDVQLLPAFFDVHPGSEEAEQVAALVQHWEQLAAIAADAADGDAPPLAAALRDGWWRQRPPDEGPTPDPGEAEEESAAQNPRDRIFELALPVDWVAEAEEPPGLACTLFRYQRRCLAWLKWRESLRGAGDAQDATGCSLGDGEAGGSGGVPLAAAAPPDPGSAKSDLPQHSLLWQPLTLPSGAAIWYNPLAGCPRRRPVSPPLPQVAGGLLADEMGLGKTVEMLALFLARPPPPGWLPHRPPTHPGASEAQAQAAPGGGEAVGREAGAGEPQAAVPDASLGAIKGGDGGPAGSPRRGGTLVVCPPALLQQWAAELSNHAHGALAVEVYDGLGGLGAALRREGPAAKRLKPGQREAELYSRLLQGGSVQASYDAAAEAAAALCRLSRADVVLTSFDVLRAEVHFVPRERELRHRKRYQVPHCPLLQMRWWRLVVDEAQMVGPLSAVGTMMERMAAAHRWCVTGTPMGSHKADELADMRALLHILAHQPFEDERAWRRLVAEPMAEGGAASAGAWRLLARVLRPLMWRATKAVVAREFSLPHRSLQPVWLAFQAGERAFYEQVVEKARQARQELAEFRRRQGHPADTAADDEEQGGGDGGPVSPAQARTRKRRQAKQSERLELAAADNLSQLRLACIHPQLTKDWKAMAAEGQLGVGTTLSMEEIMQRLVDAAQGDLQEAERQLCAHLNTLAMRLAARAQQGGGGGSPASGPARRARQEGSGGGVAGGGEGEGEQEEEEEGRAGSPRPAKRARRSRGGLDALGPAALRAEAVRLLEQSFRVAEKGIAAMDKGMAELEGMPDIPSAATSTVNAWKRLQINTASQLGRLYEADGREEEARKMDQDVQEKVAYLRSQAEMEAQQAQQRLDRAQAAAEAARQGFRLHLEAAAERGFVGWGLASSAAAWLGNVERLYRQAQRDEEGELEGQQGIVKHMLGTRVAAVLEEAEKQLHSELTVLDRFVSEQRCAAAHRRLLREQQRWDAAEASGGGLEVLENGVAAVWEVMHALPEFRRKTLVAQHVDLFGRQVVDEAERKHREASRRREQAALAKAAAAAAAGLTDAEADDDDEKALLQPEAEQQRQGLQGQQAGPGHQQGVQHAAEQGSRQPSEGSESSAVLAAILRATEGGQAFVCSGGWCGRVPGYAFKLGGQGLGYYKDEAEPFLTAARLHAVAAAVGRALGDYQRRLARTAGPEAALFAALPLDGVEAKLDSVKAQVQLVRCLREQHVAERGLALQEALGADLDAGLRDAAVLPPQPGAGSVDRLVREIAGLREKAEGLLHRMRYMQSRVSEARSLQPAAQGPGQGEQPGLEQQQQQHQQQQEGGGSGPAGEPAPPADQQAAAGVKPHAGEGGDGLECPVCLSLVPASADIHVFGGCGHAFCQDCAGRLVLQQGFCAVCRQKVTARQVFRVAAGAGTSGGAACDPEFDALGGIRPVGEWSAKVEALLRRLIHLATTSPAEKSLVFSQFPDALKMAGMALQTNGIRFVQLLGGKQAARKAVASFREDDDVKVFLLSHRAGAQGLTLVRASRVFLLEPALEPAIEQQAVARVHRIGQQRPVVVTRLLVRDSIEQRVLAVQEAKHALFAGADGGAEDTAELATTVEAPVGHEALDRRDVEGLLEGV